MAADAGVQLHSLSELREAGGRQAADKGQGTDARKRVPLGLVGSGVPGGVIDGVRQDVVHKLPLDEGR